jgi:hypothetical protein
MQVVAERSMAGQSLWCKSPDGHAAQWTELKGETQRQVCRYQDGAPEGPFRGFHHGGSRWLEGQFRRGLKEGAWQQWDDTGSLVAEGDYRGGRLVGGAPVATPARCEELRP